MATISDVSICNSALIKIGAERITSLDQDTKPARLCKDRYPILRNEVLESFPWSFAIKRKALALLAGVPVFEWAYAYALPSDFLAMIHGNDWEVAYSIENGMLLTNESNLAIKYIYENTNAGMYSYQFAEALAWRIAADLAYPIANSTTLASAMLAGFVEFLRNARFRNSAGSTPEGPVVDAWIGARV